MSETFPVDSMKLNIICFDVPFPADYGGAMEEFYKLKALHALGVKIYLHCFIYGDRSPQLELEKYCEEVYYYTRKRRLKDLFSNLPFIVQSRKQTALLNNLCDNDYPILFDAMHTAGFLDHPDLKHRKKIVRLHNIEWIYYNTLLSSSYTLRDKFFYFFEYKKLKKFDNCLQHADILLCLSQYDFEYYKEKFPDKIVELIYVFHENTELKVQPGKGDYILYHGNLSVLDNYTAVIDLLSNHLKGYQKRIVLAGKNPGSLLVDFIKDKPNIELIANPTQQALTELIRNAQICFAIAANPSGIKLKLINSLYSGRFIFGNNSAISGSGLEEAVINIDQQPEVITDIVNEYMLKEFTDADLQGRKELLAEKYNNTKNAESLTRLIFSH